MHESVDQSFADMSSCQSTHAPLADKINAALSRLVRVRRKWGDAVCVAWTGGKDSTVALDLWRRVLAAEELEAPARAINLDTGHKFPQVVAFRDRMTRKWGVNLHVARPDAKDIPADWRVAQDKVACCGLLKIAPLKRAIYETGTRALITGLRRDEHPDRAARQWLERRGTPHYAMVNPILDFTEMDVWAYHMQQALEYCPLYDAGYRSLGCVECTAAPDAVAPGAGERDGRDPEKERNLETLRSLGYF